MSADDPIRSQREALGDALVFAIEQTAWTVRRQEAGITVSSGFPAYGPGEPAHPAEGFLIAAELDGVSVDHGLAYFHDACHFADTANDKTSASQIVEVWSADRDAYEAVVRTGFALPWPLQDREFLHYVTTLRAPDAAGRDTGRIVYATVARPGVAPWPGALRCTMRPSGQRVTDLGGGRVRVEHCMTYDLGGWVGPRLQNLVFSAGHVTAYFDEWAAAMAALQREAASPAATVTRAAGGTRWAPPR